MVLDQGLYSYCHSYIESGDLSDKKTIVGKYTSINSINIIGWASHGHMVGEISTYPFGYHAAHLTDQYKFNEISRKKVLEMNRTTYIGNNVWIGSNVTIKCGVKIGDGAIIGFNSNVTKDVPPYTIVGGNPAKIIKKKHCDEIIEKLLLIKWWDWTDEKIKENSIWFLEKSIEEFVDFFGKDLLK